MYFLPFCRFYHTERERENKYVLVMEGEGVMILHKEIKKLTQDAFFT